jgi:hypothetical protein
MPLSAMPGVRQTASHGYRTVHYVPSRDALVRFGAFGLADSGSSHSFVDVFDRATKKWLPEAAWPELPGLSDSVGVFLPASNRYIYTRRDSASGEYMFASYEAGSGAFERLAYGASIAAYTYASAYDSKRNRIVSLPGGSGTKASEMYLFDLATKVATKRSLPQALDYATNTMTYDREGDQYLVAETDSTGVFVVSSIDPVSLMRKPVTTSGPPPVWRNTNIYSKWMYADDLGAVLFCNRATEDVWFLKVH